MSRARDAGFTLIELLVSLTLLGLVFAILFGSLHFGARAWERTTASTSAIDSVGLAQDVLRRSIERACPRLMPGAEHRTPQHIDFSGSPGAIRFLGPAPLAAGGQDCARLSFEVRPDGTRKRLVVAVGSSAGGTDLLRHAESVEFAYRATTGGWKSEWSGATLPALVRLRVTFSKGDPRLWPELFVAPRISAEVDCTYDAATGTCRSG